VSAIPPPGHFSSPEGLRSPLAGSRDRRPPQKSTGPMQRIGQESNLHSSRGRVTAAWARRCPADTALSFSLRGRARTCTLRLPTPARCRLRYSKIRRTVAPSVLRPMPLSLSVAQGGVGPPASLGLSKGGLPVASRATTSAALSKSSSKDMPWSRECPAGVEPACPVWKTDAWAARPRARPQQRKERESNPQGPAASPA
jgi:hypothetical protein